MGYFCYVFLLVFEENLGEMNISHGVFDVFVAEEVLDVEGVWFSNFKVRSYDLAILSYERIHFSSTSLTLSAATKSGIPLLMA